MTDLSDTIIAKSDQLNADDLIDQDLVITITNVNKVGGDQPIAIEFENSGGKVFKPCKTMRRALVAAWGKDGSLYIGRQIQLYRDPSVKYAGKAVGGIRIRALSHIDQPLDLALSETRGKKKLHHIDVLKGAPAQQPAQKAAPTPEQQHAAASKFVDGVVAKLTEAPDQAAVDAIVQADKTNIDRIKEAYPDLYKKIEPVLVKQDAPPPADDNEMAVGNF